MTGVCRSCGQARWVRTHGLEVVAHGRPAPQGSKGVGPYGQLREVSRFLPAWREKVKLAALRACHEWQAQTGQPWPQLDEPVRLLLTFLLARPDRPAFESRPAVPPDWDKLARAVCDSLTDAKVYLDDSRVVEAHVSKRWAASPDHVGVLVVVLPLDEDVDPGELTR